MGLFRKMSRRERGCLPLVLGGICVFSLRFISHLISGIIFFTQGAVWVTLPAWAMGNAFVYSFIYQCVYIPLDAVIALSVLIALCKSGILDRLITIMNGKKK